MTCPSANQPIFLKCCPQSKYLYRCLYETPLCKFCHLSIGHRKLPISSIIIIIVHGRHTKDTICHVCKRYYSGHYNLRQLLFALSSVEQRGEWGNPKNCDRDMYKSFCLFGRTTERRNNMSEAIKVWQKFDTLYTHMDRRSSRSSCCRIWFYEEEN